MSEFVVCIKCDAKIFMTEENYQTMECECIDCDTKYTLRRSKAKGKEVLVARISDEVM